MAALSEALKAEIQAGYRAFLAHRNLQARLGQRQMIGTIAATLGKVEVDGEGERQGDAPICVVEAGTGTGKTLAYLLATLPIARALGKTVVVATGTVSLQSQLVDKDIPELLAATGWHYRFALAKGRGRYLCNIKLEQCLDAAGARDAGMFLFEDEIGFNPDRHTLALIKDLGAALDAGDWDGDRDSWPDAIPDASWRALTVDRRQCAGHRCRKINQCSFFQARATLEDADCIIANHDLVMADLALGGGVILPAPGDTIYVFDEAHRLADITLRHFGATAHLQGSIQWLEQVHKGLAIARKGATGDPATGHLLDLASHAVDDALRELRQSAPLWRAQLDELLAPGADHYRFPGGDVGELNRDRARRLAAVFTALDSRLSALAEELEKALDNPHHPLPRVDLEQLFQAAGNWLGRVEAVTDLWRQMAEADEPGQAPRARWLAPDDNGQDVLVAVSPISAAELLRTALWNRCFGAVAASATLRALGTFERFAATTGLPRHAVTLAVPGAFDFAAAGVLAIPDIGADGGEASAHTEALINRLGDLIDPAEGTLVLFSSRRQMEAVAEAMEGALRERLLVQGAFSHGEIIRRHREAVDGGRGSVIFGLASFAEGLDLPGDYCRHVVIAKLPFAVPDNPLQAAQAEWLESRGLNAFKAMTLPDTSLRLIQACGRLLRTEQDRGRVTILDRRLVTKFYGRQLLDSLPPFRREIG
ncbi:MAG: ATP-dependent DNA helicase DinG [Porticoccaceae bacterium]|nr:ATP-dependent DNA helicase DinG [Pseudomonadota bacterium]HLS99065.1 ATP-dependent DNA helicase DinG [Porticoccaceae bacterium]